MADAAVATPASTGGQGTATPGATGTPANTNVGTSTFYDSVADAGVKEWIGTKGFQNWESVAKSAHSLEKMIGAPADEVVRIPRSATPEQIRAVLSKIGLPDT